MCTTPLVLPKYQKKDFISREREIESVVQKIESIREEDDRLRGKAVVFSGGRGHGKTWLMAHLHRCILKDISQVKSFFISLYNTSTFTIDANVPNEYQTEFDNSLPAQQKSQKIEEQIRRIQHKINTYMEATYMEEASNRELVTWLVSRLKQEEKELFVILVDSAFESDWDLLDQLEKNLLEPLSDLPNILFVISGRGTPYPWTSPNLKAYPTDSYELKAFANKEDSLKLLKKSPKPEGISNSKIVKISGGYPSNLALLDQLEPTDSLADHLDKMVENHLEVVPTSSDRVKVRGYLEAISILQEGFRDEEIKALLECYRKHRSEQSNLNDSPREIRTLLLNTYLVSWKDNGCHIDESVRCILETFLKEKHFELWWALHQQTYNLYMEWARKFERHKQHFEKLANKHKKIIDNHERPTAPSGTPTSNHVVTDVNEQLICTPQVNSLSEQEEKNAMQVLC